MARPSLLSHQVNHRSVKRRLMEPSPFAEARRSEARLLAIQSAPDSMSSLSGAVVRRAKTRAPAALPARRPAGGASGESVAPGGRTQSFLALVWGWWVGFVPVRRA